MKFSIFNNIISLPKEHFLLYNSFTDTSLVISSAINNVFRDKSTEIISDEHPSFYDKLITAGCILPKETDEVTQLQERIDKLCNDDSRYSLIINPTINCNFKCWYCYEEHIPGAKMSDDVLCNVKKHITNITSNEKLKYFHLSFFGGEPLLYFDKVVVPIIDHYNEQCIQNNVRTHVSFTTNGYLINEKMIEEFVRCKVNSFQITIDGNREQHNKTRFPYVGGESYDKILENIKKLIALSMRVTMRINYTRDNLASISDIEQYLASIPEEQRKYISVNFQRVWQDHGSKDGTCIEAEINDIVDGYIDIYSELGIHASKVMMDFVNYSCYADKRNEAVINFDGKAFKCTARNFDSNNEIGYLNQNGDVIWAQERVEHRFKVRYSKEVCHSCRIAPLCGGTCGQKIIESGNNNVCLMGLDEVGKDKIVLERFYLKHVNSKL